MGMSSMRSSGPQHRVNAIVKVRRMYPNAPWVRDVRHRENRTIGARGCVVQHLEPDVTTGERLYLVRHFDTQLFAVYFEGEIHWG